MKTLKNYQKCLKYRFLSCLFQTQVSDYTVRGAVRAAVIPCVSTAGLHCKDVSCRSDNSSTEVWVSAACRDLLTVSGSFFFWTSTFFVSLYPLSLEASDREALGFFSFFLWGSCTMLWRWRLCFMVNFFPQPTCVQTQGRNSSWKEPMWLSRLNTVVNDLPQPWWGHRRTTRVSAWTRWCCWRNQESRNTLLHWSHLRIRLWEEKWDVRSSQDFVMVVRWDQPKLP